MKKCVFITGGTVGTGYATAEKFAEAGYGVFIASRSAERAQEAADKLAAKYGVHTKGYGLGIRDEEAVKAVFADIDAQGCFVQTVVLNAANMGFDPQDPAAGQDFWTVPVEAFGEVFETNLVWNFTMIRQAALMGCLERNAEYEVALEEKEYVLKRIKELMYVISNCKIV